MSKYRHGPIRPKTIKTEEELLSLQSHALSAWLTLQGEQQQAEDIKRAKWAVPGARVQMLYKEGWYEGRVTIRKITKTSKTQGRNLKYWVNIAFLDDSQDWVDSVIGVKQKWLRKVLSPQEQRKLLLLEQQDPSTIDWHGLEFEELHKHAQSLGLSMSSHPSLKFLKKIVGRWHKRHEQEMKEQLEKETQERIQEEQRIKQLKEQEEEWRKNWRKEHAAAVAAAPPASAAAPAAAAAAMDLKKKEDAAFLL